MRNIINPRLALSTRSGNWEVAYSERVDGKTVGRRVSTWTKDRLKAETFLTGWLTGEERVSTSLASPLVTDLIDAYEQHIKEKRVGETQHYCLAHLRRGFSHVHVSDLTASTQRRYRENRREAGVKDGTLRRELGALRAVLGHAVKDRVIAIGDVPHIELPRQSQAKETYLTKSQADDFLEHAANYAHGHDRLPRITRFVYLALMTAARKEAIENLTWDRIDWDAGMIDYREAGEQITNKRRVRVPISKRLRPMLETMYAQRKTKYVLDNNGSIRKAWSTWIKGTPYDYITPHDLRRTWATLAAQAGVPLIDVAAVLGDSVEIVIKHYAHHVPGAAKRAVDSF